MAAEVSSIIIYKENKPSLIALVNRIMKNHNCTIEEATKALTVLFKNSTPADFEDAKHEKVEDETTTNESKLFSPEKFRSLRENI